MVCFLAPGSVTCHLGQVGGRREQLWQGGLLLGPLSPPLQTSLDIHPKPKLSFVITSLTTTYCLSMDYHFDGIKRMALCEENFGRQ